MEQLPFKELIGVIVAAIYIAAQAYGAYQENKKQREQMEENVRRRAARKSTTQAPPVLVKQPVPTNKPQTAEEQLAEFLKSRSKVEPKPQPIVRPIPTQSTPPRKPVPEIPPKERDYGTMSELFTTGIEAREKAMGDKVDAFAASINERMGMISGRSTASEISDNEIATNRPITLEWGGVEGLRRALIMSEILGAPRALKSL